MTNPETRESLILRLPSAADAQAWREFVDLYEPLIIRFAKRRGLQEADAREVAQNVLIAVAKAVDRWQPDRERGKFRAWLFRIAKNQVINWVKKNASNGVNTRDLLDDGYDVADRSDSQNSEWEMEYRREMFRLAAAQARDSFSDHIWEAFWRTSVLGETVESVASQLSVNTGTVYVSRSRVTARIKAIIQQWERSDAI